VSWSVSRRRAVNPEGSQRLAGGRTQRHHRTRRPPTVSARRSRARGTTCGACPSSGAVRILGAASALASLRDAGTGHLRVPVVGAALDHRLTSGTAPRSASSDRFARAAGPETAGRRHGQARTTGQNSPPSVPTMSGCQDADPAKNPSASRRLCASCRFLLEGGERVDVGGHWELSRSGHQTYTTRLATGRGAARSCAPRG
jgi:hypothetical protein